MQRQLETDVSTRGQSIVGDLLQARMAVPRCKHAAELACLKQHDVVPWPR